VEDQAVEYQNLEGVIAPGEYGAGTVMVWDFGTYKPLEGKHLFVLLDTGDLMVGPPRDLADYG